MQPNLPDATGVLSFLLWVFIGVAVIGGYIVMLVALWRSMKAHESIARAVSDIARHLEGPRTTKHDADRFSFSE
jgi:hypothetical protein